MSFYLESTPGGGWPERLVRPRIPVSALAYVVKVVKIEEKKYDMTRAQFIMVYSPKCHANLNARPTRVPGEKILSSCHS